MTVTELYKAIIVMRVI